jgi:ABC-type thiamin/hydroxymethylpyrimidine transport system permease subunit
MSKKLIVLNVLCLLFAGQFLVTTDFNNMRTFDYIYAVALGIWAIVIIGYIVVTRLGKER